jgi:hypothetical protein
MLPHHCAEPQCLICERCGRLFPLQSMHLYKEGVGVRISQAIFLLLRDKVYREGVRGGGVLHYVCNDRARLCKERNDMRNRGTEGGT